MPELPNGIYSIIYADPPWTYDIKTGRGSAANHYDTMSLEDIKSMPVQNMADDDCVLFMWATYPLLAEALEVINVWGFTYKSVAFPGSNLIKTALVISLG